LASGLYFLLGFIIMVVAVASADAFDDELESGGGGGRRCCSIAPHHQHTGFLVISLFAFCILASFAQYYSLVCCNTNTNTNNNNGYKFGGYKRLYIISSHAKPSLNLTSSFNFSSSSSSSSSSGSSSSQVFFYQNFTQ